MFVITFNNLTNYILNSYYIPEDIVEFRAYSRQMLCCNYYNTSRKNGGV